VLFDLSIIANVMQMSIMQIIDVIAVLDRSVLAIGTMHMVVMGV